MRNRTLFRTGLAFAGLLSLFAVFASASTYVVCARRHGEWLPVIRASGATPYVLDGDKLVAADRGEFTLIPMTHYRKGMPAPVILRVDDMKVGTQGIQFVEDSHVINNQFDISMTLRAPIDLTDVFVVFVITDKNEHKSVVVREVGALKAGAPDHFEYHTPIESEMGAFKYEVRFFSSGFELFYAGEGWDYINGEISQRILAEAAGIQKSNPRPYSLTPPVIPLSVRKSGQRVIVKVRATVLADGSTSEVSAAPGAAPDQADAAVTAVRLSYFLPKISDGKPEKCKVVIPVVLDPQSRN